MFWIARMCSFEKRSGRRKSYSLTVRSSADGAPPLATVPSALSSAPIVFSSASISHCASVLLIYFFTTDRTISTHWPFDRESLGPERVDGSTDTHQVPQGGPLSKDRRRARPAARLGDRLLSFTF